MRSIVEEKVRRIGAVNESGKIYVETNHCFIKGFGWLLPEYVPDDRIGVVVLRRDRDEIVRSLTRTGCTPLVPYGRNWIITPEAEETAQEPPWVWLGAKVDYQILRCLRYPWRLARLLRALIRIPLDGSDLNAALKRTGAEIPRWMRDYEVDCLEWYVDEIEARAQLYRSQFPGCIYHQVDIQELNSTGGVQSLLDRFGCSVNEGVGDLLERPTNLKNWRSASG